jgi:hypothetical protein
MKLHPRRPSSSHSFHTLFSSHDLVCQWFRIRDHTKMRLIFVSLDAKKKKYYVLVPLKSLVYTRSSMSYDYDTCTRWQHTSFSRLAYGTKDGMTCLIGLVYSSQSSTSILTAFCQ